jgi:hypothetical protein
MLKNISNSNIHQGLRIQWSNSFRNFSNVFTHQKNNGSKNVGSTAFEWLTELMRGIYIKTIVVVTILMTATKLTALGALTYITTSNYATPNVFSGTLTIDRVLYQINGDSNSLGSGRFYLNSSMNNTGVDGIATSEQSWLVYPNPTTADGEISIANPKGLLRSVTVVNALGGVIHTQEIKANELGVKVNLSPLDLSTGVYFIHLMNSNQQTTERLIIRNN